jgi:hypothetical protein
VNKIEAEEAATFDLSRRKKVAERRLGISVTRAVPSIPASFDGNQRKGVEQAAETSGLNVIHLLSEPTAALWLFRGQRSDITSVAVHLRRGTFDVSVIWFQSNHFEVLAMRSSGVRDRRERFVREQLFDRPVAQSLSLKRTRPALNPAGSVQRLLADNRTEIFKIDPVRLYVRMECFLVVLTI